MSESCYTNKVRFNLIWSSWCLSVWKRCSEHDLLVCPSIEENMMQCLIEKQMASMLLNTEQILVCFYCGAVLRDLNRNCINETVLIIKKNRFWKCFIINESLHAARWCLTAFSRCTFLFLVSAPAPLKAWVTAHQLQLNFMSTVIILAQTQALSSVCTKLYRTIDSV